MMLDARHKEGKIKINKEVLYYFQNNTKFIVKLSFPLDFVFLGRAIALTHDPKVDAGEADLDRK